MKNKADLSANDVEFLQAVRHIQMNTDDYPELDQAQVPVTTGALKTVLMDEWDTVCDWSDTMVDYRMSEGDRGWGEEGLGLVTLYEAEYLEEQREWTSRGIELTDAGFTRLETMEKRMSMSRAKSAESGEVTGLDSSVDEVALEVDQVKQEVEELNDQLSELVETVNRFQELETGALDPQIASQVRTVFDRVVRHQQIFKQVLDLNTDPYSPNNEQSITQDLVAESRNTISGALETDISGGAVVDESGEGLSESGPE